MEREREERIKYWIIKKLDRKGYWGRRLINFDDLRNPKCSKKDTEDICKDLVKKGILKTKPGQYGKRYSLNPKNKGKIIKEMGKLQKKCGIKPTF